MSEYSIELYLNEKKEPYLVIEDEEEKEYPLDPETSWDILKDLVHDHSEEIIEGIMDDYESSDCSTSNEGIE